MVSTCFNPIFAKARSVLSPQVEPSQFLPQQLEMAQTRQHVWSPAQKTIPCLVVICSHLHSNMEHETPVVQSQKQQSHATSSPSKPPSLDTEQWVVDKPPTWSKYVPILNHTEQGLSQKCSWRNGVFWFCKLFNCKDLNHRSLRRMLIYNLRNQEL